MQQAPEIVEFFINNEMDVLRARKKGDAVSRLMGFSEIERAEIEIAIGEMASNVVKYAKSGGTLSILPTINGEIVSLKIISKNTPIIPAVQMDMERYLEDGFSLSGSLGIGLSGIKRLMDEFETTVEDSGLIVISAIKHRRRISESRIKYSVMSFPKQGERVSGDAFYIKSLPSSFFWGVIDALGHGVGANITAVKALAILENNYSKSLVWIITQCHKALQKERGAAICLGRVDLIAETVEYISVGNIETRIYNGERATHLYSVNGTVGAAIPIINPVVVPYIRTSCIVSFTDGISHRFELDKNMLVKSPQEIAYHIINSFRRDYDDTTVVVIK